MVRCGQPPIEAATLREPAGKIGAPAETLELRVATYNAACPRGPIDTSTSDRKRTAGVEPSKSNGRASSKRGLSAAIP